MPCVFCRCGGAVSASGDRFSGYSRGGIIISLPIYNSAAELHISRKAAMFAVMARCSDKTAKQTDSAMPPAAAAPLSGYFTVGEKYSLPYYAMKFAPPPLIDSPQTGSANPALPTENISRSCRGTILLFKDFGQEFAADAPLLAALQSRGFHIIGYNRQCASKPARKAAGRRKQTAANRKISLLLQRSPTDPAGEAAFAAFLQNIALPDYPAPFYILAQGDGALFALRNIGLFGSFASRIMAVAPPMSINGHLPRHLYHYGLKALNLFAFKRKNDAAARGSLAYRLNLLDNAAFTLSKAYAKNMTIPCLMLAAGGSSADRAALRLMTENLRLADYLPLSAASSAALCDSLSQNRQFWAAFDAFIPGSDAAADNDRLEHAFLL